ncbi:DUF2793 domain-containing protein [Ancylobacter sp. VNQ12]|uniref:DUF2793 domain-containing protein n=1 Tax=Ancylobacter sp. VNQ12 TaxID=3400920 RepID=UPI003C0297CD
MSSFYSTGTASVVAGSAAVTGDGTMWAATLLPGDVFCRAGLMVPIASIESQTALTLAYGWPGASAAGAAYIVNYSSPTRSEPGYLAARTREALDKLGLLENNVPYYDVQSVGLNAPPATPILGDTYVVGTAPTGAWAGRAKMLAQWAGSAWAFTAPAGGWHVYSLATDQIFALVAGSWQLTDGVASVVGQTGTVTATQIKAAIASSYFQTLMPAVDASAALTTLGVSTYIKTLLDDADQAAARVTLGAQAALGYTPVNKAGDTLAGTLNVRASASEQWSLAQTSAVTLLDGASISFSASSGFLIVADNNNGNHGYFKLANAAVARLDSGPGFSMTFANSGTVNVLWYAPGPYYIVQNNRGGPIAINVMNFKMRDSG